MHRLNRWSLILAAGAGTRLQQLTSCGSGAFVPKQFCSLHGGPSLLEETISRALGVAPIERTLVVVAAEHRAYWESVALPASNLIVQPENRGTANGILLGATAIMERDPEGLLTILPADHHVKEEAILRRALEQTLTDLEANAASRAVSFMGIQPEYPDPELGYIVYEGRLRDGSYRIRQFVEKPSRDRAAELIRQSALWNSFILVSRTEGLAALIAKRFPRIAYAYRHAWRRSTQDGASSTLGRLYRHLPTIDFSRHVAEGGDPRLRVVPVPHCGWSDLGTPQRVADCLIGIKTQDADPSRAESRHLILAEACRRHNGSIGASAEVEMTS